MAIRVENGAGLNFGTFGAAATVSHIRIRRGSDDGQPVVKALGTPVTVAVNEQFAINPGNLDIVYPAGDLTNAHMLALVEGYWGTTGSRTSMEIDAMTDASTVVSVSGYAQQSTNDWDVTQEND